jgi:hypothetical protein
MSIGGIKLWLHVALSIKNSFRCLIDWCYKQEMLAQSRKNYLCQNIHYFVHTFRLYLGFAMVNIKVMPIVPYFLG